MTSPAELITIECPECGTNYEDSYRASINLDLEDWSEEELEEATSATCPSCGHKVAVDSLVVQGNTWTFRD